MLRRGQPDSRESCIVLESRPTCSLIAKFLQHSVIVCSTWISCRKGRTFRSRPCVQTFYAWCRSAQSTSERSQLCELSRPTFGFTTQEISMVGGYMENLETVKLGVGTCPGQYSNTKYFTVNWVVYLKLSVVPVNVNLHPLYILLDINSNLSMSCMMCQVFPRTIWPCSQPFTNVQFLIAYSVWKWKGWKPFSFQKSNHWRIWTM